MTPTETALHSYFERLVEIRGTGDATGETSYYSALENLLNELGKSLDPKVICNGQIRDKGAGRPDFGLYSGKQCSKSAPKPGQGEIPERGVVEVKSLGEPTSDTAQSEQTGRYFELYRLVLVTNYREFRLIGEGEGGKPEVREFFSLAEDEDQFWSMVEKPLRAAREHGTPLGEFLRRVMMSAAALTRPEDVAWFLASHAREALAKLERNDGSTLAPLRSALETALGIKFDIGEGEHFFRSTLVQTLFYGIFSAWAVWAKRGGIGKFDWKTAGFILTLPMIRALFEELVRPSRLVPLGLMNFLDRTGDALNRIDHSAFFKSFDNDDALQHFYEPFLKSFDPELRKRMGVWYTPREIVEYMVERVDAVLRSELGVADGLADKSVYVLDPCCGTGAYVVEVLRRIEKTLSSKHGDALVGQDVREAARKRVFGFEIMSAPYVIAHWRVADLLARLDAPVNPANDERPAIYLTNALTGWGKPEGSKEKLPQFQEFLEERDRAERVKRKVPILVVIGNPPYNAFAGTSPAEEEGLVDPYKEGLITRWKIMRSNIDDLYVRFFRIAERRIETTGRGIVSYISNYSWTRGRSFVVMREHLLRNFDKFWIENMHGDRNRTERAPDGTTSETIFAMPGFSSGIRQGVVISLAVRSGKDERTKVVRYRNDIDAGKAAKRRKQLLDSLAVVPFDDQYQISNPQEWNSFAFFPLDVGQEYKRWPKIVELSKIKPMNGLLEKRGGGLIDIDRAALAARMQDYFDPNMKWKSFQETGHPLAKEAARYIPWMARRKARDSGVTFDDGRIVRYIVRPFDVRHAYYTEIRPIWNECRPKLWAQFEGGNRFLMTRPSGVADPEGAPAFFTRCLGDNNAQRGQSYYIPFHLNLPADGTLPGETVVNLSDRAREWLRDLGLSNSDIDSSQDGLTVDGGGGQWLHVIAIAYAPRYIRDNADGLAIEWPRVPLPNERELLEASALLGAQVAALLDTEAEVPGITNGEIAEHLRAMGIVTSTDLRVTGWGSRDGKGRVNPGLGNITLRDWTDDEKDALSKGLAAENINKGRGFELLGRAVDIHLNETTCWRGVPEAAWEYVIGGYRVIKKWLSYRDESVIGRALDKDEAREVTAMVRRLTALVLLGDRLDANYEASRDNAYDWPTPK